MRRQINFSTRKPKIRGIKRRLRALDLWANSLKDYFPIERSQHRYWHCKIPILNILVNQPRTNHKIQRHCVKALIEAVCHLVEARSSSLSTAKVTVLITYPDMFGSEICIFFDDDYFSSFFDRHKTIAKSSQVFKRFWRSPA